MRLTCFYQLFVLDSAKFLWNLIQRINEFWFESKQVGPGISPGVRAAIFNCVSLPGSACAGVACVPSYYDINSSDDRVSPRTRSLQVSWTPFWLRRSTVVAPLPASQLLSLKEEERRIFWSRKEVIGGSEASPIRILAKNMITYLWKNSKNNLKSV